MTQSPQPRLDSMLILPPQWTPLCIYYALPVLSGEIQRAGYSCKIKDLNIAFFNRCLSPEYLDWCRQGAAKRQEALSMDFILKLADEGSAAADREDNAYFEMEQKIQQAELTWDTVIANIENAKRVIRDSKQFYEPFRLQWAFDTICKGLEIAGLPYFPTRFMLRDFQTRDLKMTMEAVIAAVDNHAENPFPAFYQEVLPEIQAENPRIIGISINASSQIIGGLTLAGMLKEHLPDTVIVIGGNFFTRVVDSLMDRPVFFERFCHVLVYEEGERPFTELLDAVTAGSTDWSRVPNIVYQAGGKIVKNPGGCFKPLNEIAEPNLDGVDPGAYLTPELVMPIQASRGCYWKKCTFCDHDFGANFNLKSIDKLITELKVLRDQYGVRHFEFIDEAISPAYLRRMCEAFIAHDLDIRFFMYARTERGFSQELMDLAYRAGCRMIMWGIESGSERIMKLIEKGVPLDTRFEPLKMANAAGIWNFCFLFFGFPTETVSEAMQTINMIIDHKEIINSYGMSHFTLGKHTRMRDDPSRFAIANIREDEEELSTKLHYEVVEGMTPAEVLKMSELCTEICNRIYRAPLWFSIGFREFLHLYLDRDGFEAVKKFSYADNYRSVTR